MSDKRGTSKLDADLEAEIAAALGDASLDELMDSVDAADDPIAAEAKELKNGRVGVVAGLTGGDVIVELGPKDQGVCPGSQFKEPPAVGTRLAFIAERFDEGEGLWVLSRPGGTSRATFDTLSVGLTVEAKVTGHNAGGLELEVAKQRAFMPVSHIELHRVEDLSGYMNQKLRCEIVELDLQRKRIVLSRRSVLAADREREMERVMTTFEPGAVISGTVKRIEPFGAFVEVAPGVDGLIHISDLSWSRVKDPSEVVRVGEKVSVQVLNVDGEKQRIALGLKQVAGDPWANAAHRYTPGQTVSGKVTRCEVFGAFVQLEPGVEGLVHVSQLAAERVRRVEDVVKPGQEVTVQVVDVDTDRRRISLSVKALLASNDESAGEQVTEADMNQYVARDADVRKTRAMQSLMGKFGGGGGLKGGI